MRGEGLGLHHEILLLALRDDKGIEHGSVHLPYALAGALLAELLLHEHVRVIEPKKKRRLVEPVSSKGIEDSLLDECFQKIAGAKRRGSPKAWVMRFARGRKVKEHVARDLCRRGILREDEDKILLLFTRKLYPEVDPRPESAILERMRRAIFTDAKDVEPRTVILISLAKATGILPKVFDKKQLKTRKARLENLLAGDLIGKAAKDAVEAAQGAIVAVMVATS
jgi:Golgi phosphoprotein 3